MLEDLSYLLLNIGSPEHKIFNVEQKVFDFVFSAILVKKRQFFASLTSSIKSLHYAESQHQCSYDQKVSNISQATFQTTHCAQLKCIIINTSSTTKLL